MAQDDGRPSMRDVLRSLRSGAVPDLPPDPFSPDLAAGIALNDMLTAMTDGGMPLGSAERVLGAMLAAHGIFQKETGGA